MFRLVALYLLPPLLATLAYRITACFTCAGLVASSVQDFIR
jgi:hypothetical protein